MKTSEQKTRLRELADEFERLKRNSPMPKLFFTFITNENKHYSIEKFP